MEVVNTTTASFLISLINIMANTYKFKGVALATGSETALLTAAADETIIIKSLRVTNKSGSNTPTISITNNGFFIINTQQLATNTSVEILTLPLIVEGGTILKSITAGTMSDGVDIGISYLNIKKEVTT